MFFMHMHEDLLKLGTIFEPLGYPTSEDLRYRNCTSPQSMQICDTHCTAEPSLYCRPLALGGGRYMCKPHTWEAHHSLSYALEAPRSSHIFPLPLAVMICTLNSECMKTLLPPSLFHQCEQTHQLTLKSRKKTTKQSMLQYQVST